MSEQKNTYRSIFLWGDKKIRPLEEGVRKLVKNKFGLTDTDLDQSHLFADDEVRLGTSPALSEKQIKELQNICGTENVKTDDYSRARNAHGYFFGELLKLRMETIDSPPDVVVYPKSEQEVAQLLAFAEKENIAVTPVGGRSSVTRGVETPQGGISLDLSGKLNRILEVNETNHTVTVETGVMGPQLEAHLNKLGYTCGHFPQSFEYSSVGGWVAARGAGQASTGYGKIEDLVLAMHVVTPVGIIQTKDYPATAEAWDLNKTFIGSEGCLGIITRVTMKIRSYRPKNTAYASFIFKDFETATSMMRKAMQSEIGVPHLFRISDPVETETAFSINGFENSVSDRFLKAMGYKTGSRCLMFVSVEGDKGYTHLVKKKTKQLAKKHHGFYIGGSPTKKWLKQRYESAYLRDPLMDAGIMTDTVETAVPWDKLISLWKAVRTYLEHREKSHVMVHISHVYENGANLYFTFLSPMKKGHELEDYKAYHKGLIDAIHQNGGSLSHHHGIGRALAPWMEEEIGSTAIGLMQAVKDHLDPKGILNPGNTLGLRAEA
ncbi:MAG: FAD-binding oxidoreductase [Bacteroidales bacterium]|nr:FAD-binding oxidoreductase [Bacteroidales bacterium]